MWIKTSELEGAALDWAVAKSTKTNIAFDIWPMTGEVWPYNDDLEAMPRRIHPSTNWNQGGPLIDELVYSFNRWNDGTYEANVKTGACTAIGCEGDTILIAAMRAIVASELGDEVDVPEELL